jgi:hypothetical protein
MDDVSEAEDRVIKPGVEAMDEDEDGRFGTLATARLNQAIASWLIMSAVAEPEWLVPARENGLPAIAV